MASFTSRSRYTVSPWVKARATTSAPVEPTLGDRIKADRAAIVPAPAAVRCTECGCRTAPDPDGWDAVCAPCLIER